MDLAFEEIKEYHALHAYVEAQYQANKTNYLFVDEVQMCPQFELAINSLYAKEKLRYLPDWIQCFFAECGFGYAFYRALY